jgi:hypothetical protein
VGLPPTEHASLRWSHYCLSTPPRAKRRVPRIHSLLPPLAPMLCEKSGLAGRQRAE